MKVIRAKHMGLCFGVRDAIEVALVEAEKSPFTVLGDLVHNEGVLETLALAGVERSGSLDTVSNRRVMITAHGSSDRRRQQVIDAGHELLDATCPLVRNAHERLRRLVACGYHPVVIGRKGHVEVEGLIGDFPGADVLLSTEDVSRLRPHRRFGVVAQTTQPAQRVRQILADLRRRFPESEVRFEDTVCRPTKERQSDAEALSRLADVMVVVGGPNSNNTRELAATCRQSCERVYQVPGPELLERRWFEPGDTVGITAGTSTPDDVIVAVETRLLEWAGEKERLTDHAVDTRRGEALKTVP
ncbi:MAG: 4-hydroxy-3-methylbut-2-enyl diphosphate reductase [Acidobacteriota bacterium]